MASEALWGAAAGKHSEGCSRELCEAKIAWRPIGLHAIFNSPLVRAAHSLRVIAASAAEPVDGGQAVSMMQNISDDLLDG
eukprot:6885398-Prymnesium_polylepis.1